MNAELKSKLATVTCALCADNARAIEYAVKEGHSALTRKWEREAWLHLKVWHQVERVPQLAAAS